MKRAKGEQLGGDFEQYGTPRWVTKLLVQSGALPTSGEFLEPFAGPDARIIQEIQSTEIEWTASELSVPSGSELAAFAASDVVDLHVGDYFAMQWPAASFGAAVTNPPFTRAAEALVKMRREAATVAMLLPLAWGCCAERHGMLATEPPARKLIVPDRIQFLDPTKEYECPTCGGDGIDPEDVNLRCARCAGKKTVRATSPSENHAWWVWLPGRAKATIEETLPLTPQSVRAWWLPQCSSCGGRGCHGDQRCEVCNGDGVTRPKRVRKSKALGEVARG